MTSLTGSAASLLAVFADQPWLNSRSNYISTGETFAKCRQLRGKRDESLKMQILHP